MCRIERIEKDTIEKIEEIEKGTIKNSTETYHMFNKSQKKMRNTMGAEKVF